MFWILFIFISFFGRIHGKRHVKIPKKPNILFVLADDLGFADLDWKDPSLFTPNLRQYAFADGTAYLANSYVTHLCTPTRASLMTGFYPFRTGTQNGVFLQMEKSGVPSDFPFLTENLKKVGYKNYLIGKWHLGYCKKEFLPTNRGFDHFYGYYNAQEGYFNHSSAIWNGNLSRVVHGLDLFTEMRGKSVPDRNKNGIYSTHLFTSEAIKILSKHDKSQPFFLFFSHQAVHVPLQVPIQYLRFCNPFLMNRHRHTYCGMLAAMDESFGQIVRFLKRAGLYDDTIIIFSSDNGGDTKAGASNMPLRGQKSSIWEGGTKTTTFVHGPKFISNSGERRDLFHVVDWHATILGMAGVPVDKFGDGINQWEMVSTGFPTQLRRSKFVYNIHPPMSALRHGDFKLVYESPDFLTKGRGKSRLFNLRDDPLERQDVSRKHPLLVSMLVDRLFSYQKVARKSVRTPLDLRGNPERFKGVFATGWCQ